MRLVISMDEYRRIVKQGELVLVEFYSDSDPLSRYFSRIMEDIAGRLGPRAVYIRVNVDMSPDIAESEGVERVPAALLYYRGSNVWSQEGCLQNYSKDIYVIRQGIKDSLRRLNVHLRF